MILTLLMFSPWLFVFYLMFQDMMDDKGLWDGNETNN